MPPIHIVIRRRIFFPALALCVLIVGGWYVSQKNTAEAGTLSCLPLITNAASCTSPSVIIVRMTATTNATGEVATGTTPAYSNAVMCCSGVTGLSNDCTGTFATVVRLSATTNAHFEQGDQNNYPVPQCLSVPAGGSVSVGYQANDCTGWDTTIAGLTAITNAHAGKYNAYPNIQICGTASGPSSLSLTVSTNSFGNISPGNAMFATSTIDVNTTNPSGWLVTLTSDDRTNSNTVMDLDTDANEGITDQTDWIPGAATTSPGNAVRISSLNNSNEVLAFRVMTASGTASLRAPSWWGTTDSYADSATTLWAGIASTSAASAQIGNSSVSSGGGSALSTVQYYLKVPIAQKAGAYTGPMTVTVTANP